MVFCENCKHHKHVVPYYDCDGTHYCKKHYTKTNGAVMHHIRLKECYEINKHNDCKDFKPSLIGRIRMFFTKEDK